MTRVIGKVSATEKNPSTVDEFYFWTDKRQILSPFDVVKVCHSEGSTTYGIVEEINHVTDAPSHMTSFISSDFGDTGAEIGNMDRLGINYVRARVASNTRGIYTPVLNGSLVALCDADDIKRALGLTDADVKNPLVCGYLDMYGGRGEQERQRIKVSLNSHFVVGPDGAHLNVSGISGLAAKTSYSMFLLRAMQQTTTDCAFVLFNVKGRDLLAIDEPNEELTDEDRKIYEELGLDGRPFANVRYLYPYCKNDGKKIQSYASAADFERQRQLGKAKRYKFIYENNKENLDLLLAEEDDSTGTMEACVNTVMNGGGSFGDIDSWRTLKKTLDAKSKAGSGGDAKEISVMSWRKFNRLVKKAITNDIFSKDVFEKCDEVELSNHLGESLRKGEVAVVDIANLDAKTQSFVFGSVVKSVYEAKLEGERDDMPQRIVIFVDELNKYASSDVPRNSPILRQLLDITERGRSLGIILFSVEQFRSAIHERVKGNCSTHAYGRTNAVEVSKPDYRYIPKTYQNMMTRLAPGEYIVSNPALRSLINIKFPRPAYRQFPNG